MWRVLLLATFFLLLCGALLVTGAITPAVAGNQPLPIVPVHADGGTPTLPCPGGLPTGC